MQRISYTRAETIEDAVAAFAGADGEARYIAGGTTLYDLMKLGIERPAHLVDIAGIQGLDRIESDGETLRFGAMSSMSDAARDDAVLGEFPVLAESLLKAASQQLRNMATLGGNLLQRTRCAYFRAGDGVYPCNRRQPGSGCGAMGGIDRGQAVLGTSQACNATSAGDWPVALVALEATIEIYGPQGARTMAVADLHRQPEETPEREVTLMPGELITAIVVPRTTLGRASTYHKVRDRESFAFALASAAVALRMDDGIVREVRVALGGVATVPWRARETERTLEGERLTQEIALEAGRAAFASARAGGHNAFKMELGARVVADALMIAAERARP